MSWNSIVGICSSIALFLPILLILLLKLGKYRSFPFLIFYYGSALLYNLMTEGYVHTNTAQTRFWGITNNLVDIPLMLLFLTYFSTSRIFTKRLQIAIIGFIVFEVIILFISGYNVDAITITLGPGVLIIAGLSLYFFIRYVKLAVTNHKATGKALMSAAVLFAYGCFTFIYLMYYVFKAHLDRDGHVKKQYKDDTFLIYFLVTIISSLLMCIGLIYERKRIRKLYELKITRKELSSIYSDTKTAAPYRTAMLDFDKDNWNQ